MVARLVLEIILILCINTCQVSCGVQCLHRCISIVKQDPSKCRIICGAEKGKSGRSARSLRSTNGPTKETKLPTIQQRNNYDCDSLNYYELFDDQGLSNPHATNVIIQYRRWQNNTIARIMWDLPKECLGKELCRGYLVQWSFPYKKWQCYQINDIDKKHFTLDEATGFDGMKRFGVTVIAFPSAKTRFQDVYMKPPPLDDASLPITVLVPTIAPQHEEHPSDFTPNQRTPQRNIDKANSTQNPSTLHKNGYQDQAKSQKEPTSLIVILVLFIVFVLCMFGLIARWICRKRKEQRYTTPIHRPNYKQVIKGAHYISYFPENTTISKVVGIYSWLISHDIDVIMDRMYDPKMYNSLGPKRFGEKFLANAEKVLMIITPGYLKLCWLDDAVDVNTKPTLTSLDEERLYNEVAYIKNELSTTMNHACNRFVLVLVNVSESHLPNWLCNTTTVSWPKDGKSDRFLKVLKGESSVTNETFEANSIV